jgi:hypothetical protein
LAAGGKKFGGETRASSGLADEDQRGVGVEVVDPGLDQIERNIQSSGDVTGGEFRRSADVDEFVRRTKVPNVDKSGHTRRSGG